MVLAVDAAIFRNSECGDRESDPGLVLGKDVSCH